MKSDLKKLEAEMFSICTGKSKSDDQAFNDVVENTKQQSLYVLIYFGNNPSKEMFDKLWKLRDKWTRLALQDLLIPPNLRREIEKLKPNYSRRPPKSSEISSDLALSVKPLHDYLVTQRKVKSKDARAVIMSWLRQLHPNVSEWFKRNPLDIDDHALEKALRRASKKNGNN